MKKIFLFGLLAFFLFSDLALSQYYNPYQFPLSPSVTPIIQATTTTSVGEPCTSDLSCPTNYYCNQPDPYQAGNCLPIPTTSSTTTTTLATTTTTLTPQIQYEDLLTVKKKSESYFFSIKKITGVGVDLEKQSIVVYAEEITDEIKAKIPSQISIYPVEIKILQKPKYLQTFVNSCSDATRPIVGGTCISTCYQSDGATWCNQGTTGALVKEISSQNDKLLTNRHVVESFDRSILKDVYNPFFTKIGEVYKNTQAGDVLVDAALITPQNIQVSNTIRDIGDYKGINTNINQGLSVKKSGARTGFTTGTTRDIHYSTIVEDIDGRDLYYDDQILATYMSDSGDSGSVILDQNNNIIGLLFAGSPDSTIANKIGNVANRMGILSQSETTNQVKFCQETGYDYCYEVSNSYGTASSYAKIAFTKPTDSKIKYISTGDEVRFIAPTQPYWFQCTENGCSGGESISGSGEIDLRNYGNPTNFEFMVWDKNVNGQYISTSIVTGSLIETTPVQSSADIIFIFLGLGILGAFASYQFGFLNFNLPNKFL